MFFCKAEIKDKERIKRYFPEDNIAAHKNFTNLFIWQNDYNIEFAEEDGFLFLRGNYNGNGYFIMPSGEGDLKKAVEKIIGMSGDRCVFYQLLQNEAEYLKTNFNFTIKEDRDSWEYIYETEKLKELSGKQLHSKKNHYNSFIKTYDWHYEEISHDTISKAKEFSLSMLEGLDDREGERVSVNMLFDNYEELGITGALLYANGETAAVTVAEYLNRDAALVHLEKADTRFNGSYAAINKLFAERTLYGTKLINREEDMGIEGLRKAKLSYHPFDFVKKYIGERN